MKSKNLSLIENYRANFPDVVKFVGDYLKTIVSKESVEVLNTSTGAIATLIKLFSKPIVDKVFDSYNAKQLKDFGMEEFLKTSISFANDCIYKLALSNNVDKVSNASQRLSSDQILALIEEEVQEIKIEPVLIFQPRFHPVVKLIKNIYHKTLVDSGVDIEVVNQFIKDFNSGIIVEIEKAFGGNFSKLLSSAKSAHYDNKEAEILNDCIINARIGFHDKEVIDYVESFGEWKKISKMDSQVNDYPERSLEYLKSYESNLFSVKALIKQYFSGEGNSVDKLLFIIADFGKGKSVFLKQYAADLAINYIKTADEYFPIYFNLRDYSNYQGDSRYGVVYDYLETKYAIKLEDEYFKNKRFIFLIDSLDESGELTSSNINSVIASVKRIQNIDKVSNRDNRIIITSRPFDDGLKQHLLSNSYSIKDKGKQVAYFLSLYGFKHNQFNSWLISLLKRNAKFIANSKSYISSEIIKNFDQEPVFDIYKKLNIEASLSFEELKRPIFGYMIYQLLVNDYDFMKVGKIGVYLSFINLLSKEAKYIHDQNYSFNLVEQIECRSILHSIASLWAHERLQGKQGFLKKADICRAMEGSIIHEQDEHVLERFRDKKINEISFLSHSYFGENDNVLHFQHQSFAEILLAEYYFKVLIKHSLDRAIDTTKVRIKLFVGQPSNQTMEFLKGLLTMFRDAASETITDEVIEKRRLLFPFVASIALDKYNKELHSENLYYNWFNKYAIDDNDVDYPSELLENWFFNKAKLQLTIDLCKSVLTDNNYEYLLSKSSRETSIFNEELTRIKADDLNVRNIDYLICLMIGSTLMNDISGRSFFMSLLDSSVTSRLISYILSNDHVFTAFLKSDCLLGTIMDSGTFQSIEIRRGSTRVNLSYSRFHKISFVGNRLWGFNFSYCSFNEVDFSDCDLDGVSFKNCTFSNHIHFALSKLAQGVFFPYRIAFKIHAAIPFDENQPLGLTGIRSTFGSEKLMVPRANIRSIESFLSTYRDIITYYVGTKVLSKREVINNLDFTLIPKEEVDKVKEIVMSYLDLSPKKQLRAVKRST